MKLTLQPCEPGRHWRLWAIRCLAAFALLAWFQVSPALTPSARAAAEKSETRFTCGMHPQVIQNKPGNCPICGMKLTPMRKSAELAPAADGAIRIDPVTTQNMGLRVATVTNGPLRRVIRTVGAVDFDETGLSEVTTKFRGWIEKLRVNTTGQTVKKGDVLFDIYSPELFSAQTEYLLLLGSNHDAGATELLANQRDKLAYLDLSEDQIATLEKERKPRRSLAFHAARDGVVLEKMAVEGQLVEAGMKLYRLANLSKVWVQCQVFEQDLPLVKTGQTATIAISYGGEHSYTGQVAFIYPSIDEKTRAAKVRVELENPALELKPGMYATAELRADISPSTLLVPDIAVLRSGESNTVFVALPGGQFEARGVRLGFRAENSQYQVLAGLKAGEQIVTSGQFMLDSESQLREAIQKMAPLPSSAADAKPAPAAPETPTAPPSATTPAPTKAGLTLYTCPMASDADVVSDKPGTCPKCEMELVPTTQVAHGKTAEKIWREQHP